MMRFGKSIQRFVTYLSAAFLDEKTFKELQLPLKVEEETYPHRGVGLTSAWSIRTAAFLALFAACHHPARRLRLRNNSSNNADHDNDNDLLTLPPPASCATLASEAYEEFVSVTVSANDHPKLAEITALNAQQSQSSLGALIARQTSRNLPRNDLRTYYIRKSMNFPSAKDWLRCQPSPGLRTHIQDDAFRLYTSLYTCSPKLFAEICTRRGSYMRSDQFGNHLLTCTRAKYISTA